MAAAVSSGPASASECCSGRDARIAARPAYTAVTGSEEARTRIPATPGVAAYRISGLDIREIMSDHGAGHTTIGSIAAAISPNPEKVCVRRAVVAPTGESGPLGAANTSEDNAMNTTTIRVKLAAMTAAVAAPAMLFLGAGIATATGSPSGGPDNPENSSSSVAVRSSTVGSVPSSSHPDFDWHPIAPVARPGSPRTAPALGTPKRVSYPEPQIMPKFEPETF